MIAAANTTKICTRCGEEKQLTEFSLRRSRPCGFAAQCKRCGAIAASKRAKRNLQRAITPREKDPARLKRCPCCGETKAMEAFYPRRSCSSGCSSVCKLCDTASSRRWNNANKQRRAIQLVAWNARNPGRRNELQRQWAAQHREVARAYVRRRAAQKRNLAETFTAAMDKFVRLFWHGQCAICGCSQAPNDKALALDHWLPLSKGNILTMKNAVLMCKACNSRKKDRWPKDVYSADVVVEIERRLEKQADEWRVTCRLVLN